MEQTIKYIFTLKEYQTTINQLSLKYWFSGLEQANTVCRWDKAVDERSKSFYYYLLIVIINIICFILEIC